MGHCPRPAVVRRFRRARLDIAGDWVSVRQRRNRRQIVPTPALLARPPLTAKLVPVADAEFVRRPAFHVRMGVVGLVAIERVRRATSGPPALGRGTGSVVPDGLPSGVCSAFFPSALARAHMSRRFRIQFGAEQQGERGQPEPDQRDDHGRQ
jgi:hypothetical protein